MAGRVVDHLHYRENDRLHDSSQSTSSMKIGLGNGLCR
jgi:hypothetical protein